MIFAVNLNDIVTCPKCRSVMGKIEDRQQSHALWVCTGCWRSWREWKADLGNKVVGRFAPVGDQDNKAELLKEFMANQTNWKIAPDVRITDTR